MNSIGQPGDPKIDARFRVMLVLWMAFVSSIAVYFLLAQLLAQPNSNGSESRIVTFVITAMGTFLALLSFALRQKFYARAERSQQPGLVQAGLIVGIALCEAPALLGLVDLVVTGNRFYFILFIVAFVGMLLHFPRRVYLERASYKLTL